METKELIIAALNGAINAYAQNGGKVYPGDKVVDYYVDSTKIADFTYRHPGCVMLYVKLEEGSGCFFLKTECKLGTLGIPLTKAYMAWEEDNHMHDLKECLDYSQEAQRENILMKDYIPAHNELKSIVSKTLKA